MITADFIYEFNTSDISQDTSKNELLKNKLHNYITFESIKIEKYLYDSGATYIATFYDEKDSVIKQDFEISKYGVMYFNVFGLQLMFSIKDVIKAYFEIITEKTNYKDIISFDELKNKMFLNDYKETVNYCTQALDYDNNAEIETSTEEIPTTNIDAIDINELKQKLSLQDVTIKNLNANVDSLTAERNRLEKENIELNDKIKKYEIEIANVKSQLDNKTKEVAILKEKSNS